MSFQGTCTWVFFCSGPNARVINAVTGVYVAGFGLADGTGQSQTFSSGPGRYRIEIGPGGDTAAWSVEVQDYY
jgi:hypothetical protein